MAIWILSPSLCHFFKMLPAKDCATVSLSFAPSLSLQCAFIGSRSDSLFVCPPYTSSPFLLTQGTLGVASLSALSRRVVSKFFPLYLATSAVPQVSPSHLVLYPRVAVATPLALAPFLFSTSALYAAPMTMKHILGGSPGWRPFGNSAYSFIQLHIEAKYSGYIIEANFLAYLKSLLSILSCFQSSMSYVSTHPLQYFHTWHAPNRRYLKLGDNDGAQNFLARIPACTVVLLGWLGAQHKHLKKYAKWYIARGIHAVTFVITVIDILSFKVENNAKEHADSLARHLV